jgi:hypothetical protein
MATTLASNLEQSPLDQLFNLIYKMRMKGASTQSPQLGSLCQWEPDTDSSMGVGSVASTFITCYEDYMK